MSPFSSFPRPLPSPCSSSCGAPRALAPAPAMSAVAEENGAINNHSLDGTENLQPIRNLLVETLSSESRNKVSEILKEVEALSKLERLLLYMELPSSQMVSDPLRQPINPLGSRSEIQLTITWIKTHLEEDSQVSLPKHEVYDEYMEYCNDNSLKALSTADFGKVMKQVYPQVRPRRLGTRGNSRYCYAGLRKKVKLEQPCTPDCIVGSEDNSVPSRVDRAEEAANYLLLEWVEKLFGERIKNVKDLGCFLIDKMYVDNQSVAAHTLLSSMKGPAKVQEQQMEYENNGRTMDQFGEEEQEIIKRKCMQGDTKMMKLEDDPFDAKRKRIDNKVSYSSQPVVLSQKMQTTQSTLVTLEKNKTQISIDKKEKPWDTGEKRTADLEDEISGIFGNSIASAMETEDAAKNDKLSQLRQLLEKNLKSTPNNAMSSAFRPTASVNAQGETTEDKARGNNGWNNFNSGDNSNNGSSLCQRRRVSFNPLVVQEPGNSNMNAHASPGTRKRHFSFQPISPRQNSLPQSPTASPFISPRSTPVPMLRSRHSSGSALPLHLLPQGGTVTTNSHKNPFCSGGGGSSSSDISRAATFGSTSECSTPFISPHGTPIPFNRSRHNSAQGRLCRSRHSSGLGGPYRSYNMPFSPMALNNLNNPYSPQPSTPITNPDSDHLGPSSLVGMTDDSQRSRHSSAESEPAIRTMILSPSGPEKTSFDATLASSGRQRHASAGHATNLTVDRQTNWCDLLGGDSLTGSGNRADEDLKSSLLTNDTSQIMDTDTFSNPLFSSTTNPSGIDVDLRKDGSSNIPDDLDMALSALKDCDNEFSRFVQENENGKD